MERNKALQTEFITTLENIKNKFTPQNRKKYEKELNALKAAIQQSLNISPREHSSFFNKNTIVKSIMTFIQKIDDEIRAVEKEMHGLEFYPSEASRLKEITFIQEIKNELTKMCQKVVNARHDMGDVFQMTDRKLR